MSISGVRAKTPRDFTLRVTASMHPRHGFSPLHKSLLGIDVQHVSARLDLKPSLTSLETA